MLHIVSELMVASALAAAPDPALAAARFSLPQPAPSLLESLPDLAHKGSDAGVADHIAALGPSAPAEQLGRERGRSGSAGGIASDTRLGGEVAGNTAVHVLTGANSIDAGSFAGSVGLPVVIQNSGANVLIQNATVINLQFK